MIRPKRQFADRLSEHQRISDLFLVVQKSLALSRSNQPYLRVTLSDRTGTVEARIWDGAEDLEPTFAKGDVVRVEGRVTLYQGTPQISVDGLSPLGEKDLQGVPWDAFLPASARPVEELWEELTDLLSGVSNPHLRALLDGFLEDSAFRADFGRVPAAKGIHHVYLGGLLEHTVGVTRLARAVAPLYPAVNADVLLAGAFLHDVGKVRELSYRAGFDYTDEGRLLGHIHIGAQMVREHAARIEGFPQTLLLHLEHLMLSHHGEREWGSPKRPKTLEALLLHALDNIDAKMTGAQEWMAREEGVEGEWTAYWKAIGRALYRGSLRGPAFGEPGGGSTMEDIEAAFLQAEREERGQDGERTAENGEQPDSHPSRQGELGF